MLTLNILAISIPTKRELIHSLPTFFEVKNKAKPARRDRHDGDGQEKIRPRHINKMKNENNIYGCFPFPYSRK